MTPASKAKRLGALERRRLILLEALPLFAKLGFQGVTTKALAERAGISEALLFQHFASKEAIYLAVQEQCCDSANSVLRFFDDSPDSTKTLVEIFQVLSHVILNRKNPMAIDRLLPTLLMRSIMEDGSFARNFIAQRFRNILPKISRCMAAGRLANEYHDDQDPGLLPFWFGHHLLVALHQFTSPERPIVDYGSADLRTIEQQATVFILRGFGIKETVISQYYKTQRTPDLIDLIIRYKERIDR